MNKNNLLNPLLLEERQRLGQSMPHRQDTVFALPKIVENFIQHANKELPRGFVAVPWTLARSVSIFRNHAFVACFPYEQIEENIVRCLDILPKLARDTLDHATDHHLY